MDRTSQRIYNERFRSRKNYIIDDVLVLGTVLLAPIVLSLLKPKHYQGSASEWAIAILIAIICLIYFLSEKLFNNIYFDHEKEMITVTTMYVRSGDKMQEIPFSALRYKERRGRVLELMKGRTLIVRLERAVIGKDTFEQIKKAVSEI